MSSQDGITLMLVPGHISLRIDRRTFRLQLVAPGTTVIHATARNEHGDIVGEVSRRLANYRLPAPALEVEITEHLMMCEGHSGAQKIAQLRDLGVGVAIDDFGTGYSALGYLQRFPISSLKIDRCFVSEMKHGGNPIVSAITGIARGFGLGIVAEGVETTDQLDQLAALGCDAMQGFYFSPPASAEVVEGLFREVPPGWFTGQRVQ